MNNKDNNPLVNSCSDYFVMKPLGIPEGKIFPLKVFGCKRKAPYKDFKGNDLFEGDSIFHPISHEEGIIIYDEKRKNIDTRWRVDYGDGITFWLGNQVNDRGQAVKIMENI